MNGAGDSRWSRSHSDRQRCCLVRRHGAQTIAADTELLEGFHDFRKALHDLRKAFWGLSRDHSGSSKYSRDMCERRDSNPDLVKDRNLNPETAYCSLVRAAALPRATIFHACTETCSRYRR